MKLFAVAVNRDDTVQVVSTEVVRETRMYYFREDYSGMPYNDPRRSAFGYTVRIDKDRAYTSARAALEAYMAKRQRHKSEAQSIIGQATKQIASANELLTKLSPAQNAEATPDGEGKTVFRA